jgi:enoyl-[acyl-carrier protein] reductase III
MMPAVFGMPTEFYDAMMPPSMDPAPRHLDGWALVLGASSGFGAAASTALARAGLDVFGVHLDRKATLPQAEGVVQTVLAAGRQAHFFNVNAADPERRAETIAEMARMLDSERRAGALRVMLHSLAFGTLKPFVTEPVTEAVAPAQMDMTLNVMAHSLVYWVRDVVSRGLMARGGRVFAMTSSGATRALPSYGPVSAAKAALESHVRQLAMELAPLGITVNAIRAGVTPTPAAQKIPGYEALAAEAQRRNPSGRLTAPEDVARAVVVLSHPDAYWITGNVIGVDGGEDIVG